MNKRVFSAFALLVLSLLACQSLAQAPASTAVLDSNQSSASTEASTSMPANNGFPDKPALPNDSGIDGVKTFPDKSAYHEHVKTLNVIEGELPPAFGAHFSAWQNCGIYDQPVELGSALHSMEHGAVWLTYAPNLPSDQVTTLQAIVRSKTHGYVLMSPYPTQTKPVVLTAWTVQLVIDSLPDDRIAKFIAYYELGPQNPEVGAPCSGAVGNPLP